MKLYQKYLDKIYPSKKVYYNDSSFMVYEIDSDNDLIIDDIFSITPQKFKRILDFICELENIKNIICEIQIINKNAESNINLYYKLGFKIYNCENDTIKMYSTFLNFSSIVRSI